MGCTSMKVNGKSLTVDTTGLTLPEMAQVHRAMKLIEQVIGREGYSFYCGIAGWLVMFIIIVTMGVISGKLDLFASVSTLTLQALGFTTALSVASGLATWIVSRNWFMRSQGMDMRELADIIPTDKKGNCDWLVASARLENKYFDNLAMRYYVNRAQNELRSSPT
jgi:hypothetical protein